VINDATHKVASGVIIGLANDILKKVATDLVDNNENRSA
jgi:hypothetical protein